MSAARKRKIRDILPWICFAVAILYGAWQRSVQEEALEERGVWMHEVTDFMNRTKRDRWSYGQTVGLMQWIEENGRLPDESELPRYSGLGDPMAPEPPVMFAPEKLEVDL